MECGGEMRRRNVVEAGLGYSVNSVSRGEIGRCTRHILS